MRNYKFYVEDILNAITSIELFVIRNLKVFIMGNYKKSFTKS